MAFSLAPLLHRRAFVVSTSVAAWLFAMGEMIGQLLREPAPFWLLIPDVLGHPVGMRLHALLIADAARAAWLGILHLMEVLPANAPEPINESNAADHGLELRGLDDQGIIGIGAFSGPRRLSAIAKRLAEGCHPIVYGAAVLQPCIPQPDDFIRRHWSTMRPGNRGRLVQGRRYRCLNALL